MMKNWFILIIVAAFYLQVNAQTPASYDREKLLDLYQSQRYAEAASYLQSIYPDDTKDIKVINQIAYCLMMAGKLPEAEKNYLKVLNQQANSLPVLFSLANIHLRRGNDLEARKYLENIVKLDSTNFAAFKQLAGLYSDDLDSQKVAYLIKANRLNPTEADVAFDLANSFRKSKKYEPAYQILSRAIEADTGNLILQQAKLPIAIQLKRYKEVVLVGEKLLSGGADGNVLKDVGIAYYHLKEYEKAITFFTTLENLKGQNETTLYYTSLCFRNLNKNKLAMDYAKKTIQEGISPYTTSYYQLLGSIYEVDYQPLSAITAYKKGLSFGSNATIFYRLGILYDSKYNQSKTASSYYQLYLKSKPDPVADKEEIAYVRQRLAAFSSKK